VAKGLPTIALNRYKNKELYAHGQLMDKDVPLYHRVPGCRTILGLEGQRKLTAEMLINLNEKLGQYNNQHLKRVLTRKDPEESFRFYSVPLCDESDIVKIRARPGQ
jgi:hypothetical protein